MMSTPSSIISKPRVIAMCVSKFTPPSAKESGVTLRIPITSIEIYRFVIRLIASARVVGSRRTPRTADVVVRA